MKVCITLLINDFPFHLVPLDLESEFEKILDIIHALFESKLPYYINFKE